jgi:hydroxymethylglutaryl-CoA reductase
MPWQKVFCVSEENSMQTISGFSKMTKEEKIQWLARQFSGQVSNEIEKLVSFWNPDLAIQKRFDEFTENTLSNFYLPFGVAPNFIINNEIFCVPMVIEESSVVAAASLAAKFWEKRGGFHAKVIDTRKVGQVHFLWQGNDKESLYSFFESQKESLLHELHPLTENMNKRGGGILGFELVDKTSELAHYWQLKLEFETCDAMGANFINSILEDLAQRFKVKLAQSKITVKDIEVIMCILSNFTPDCLVEAWVECSIDDLGEVNGFSGHDFARRFHTAVEIARVDKSRAVTHNKGIMNGVDAVILATGNDFRAIEACCHAYASESGQYRSLSFCKIENDHFTFGIRLPLALGTVGGLTQLHPLAKISLEVLNQPTARELMQIAACVGLAQNFAAVRSLVTTGIQKGHMKLHLLNILHQLGASEEQKVFAQNYFADKVVSFSAVRNLMESSK